VISEISKTNSRPKFDHFLSLSLSKEIKRLCPIPAKFKDLISRKKFFLWYKQVSIVQVGIGLHEFIDISFVVEV
jgi:hypothetical protein